MCREQSRSPVRFDPLAIRKQTGRPPDLPVCSVIQKQTGGSRPHPGHTVTQITDHAHKIRVAEILVAVSFRALSLVSDRFGDRLLAARGTYKFKAQIASLEVKEA